MGKRVVNSLALDEILGTPASITLKQIEDATATVYRHAKDEEDAKFLISILGLDQSEKMISPSKEQLSVAE